MKISSIQKVIKVGNSLAVTIPANDARVLGIDAGEDVLMSIEPIVANKQKLQKEYDDFVAEYGPALHSLSNK